MTPPTATGNENILNLQPPFNSNAANSMISALNGTPNSLLHSIGSGFVSTGQAPMQSHNSSQNGTNGRNYMSCSPHSSSSDSTSPQLNQSANSSSTGTNNNSSQNSANNSTNSTQSTTGILSINKNMNNTTDRAAEERALCLDLGLSGKGGLSAFYSNGQSLLNHNLIAAYHEQNGRRNSSDHEEENNINNLNSLMTNGASESTDTKLEQNGTMMAGLELMDKCRLNNHFNGDKGFGHLGVSGKPTLSEQDCAALSATLEKANRLFEEGLGQSNSLPFKLRHKTRPSNTNDHTSDASSESPSLDSPSSNGEFSASFQL